MNTKPRKYGFLALALMLVLACNVPLFAVTTPTVLQGKPSLPATGVPPGSPSPRPESTPTAGATLPPISHTLLPVDVAVSGGYNYDVPSDGTAPEHRAPYGDSYRINLFERPFTQNVMDYIPALDITTFRLDQDANFYYATVQLVSGDMNDPLGINYGIELDTNHDGIGDYLIWAQPPFTPDWSTQSVQVYQDTNHDSGGPSPEKSDAPYPGNGYETLIFDQGQGNDPDLAWVRLDPHTTSTLQFAFKRSLAGNAFLWGAWADAGLKAPSQFSYNDRFTEEQAGSPEKNEAYYPIKAIYQADNTCWAPFGFKPRGDEPHLCPPITQPRPTGQQAGCVNPSQYHDQTSCVAAGCAWVQNPNVIVAVVYYCTYP